MTTTQQQPYPTPGVAATQAQVGTPAQRARANDLFGSVLQKRLGTVVKTLVEGGDPLQIAALVNSLTRDLRSAVGEGLGVTGGVTAGGTGGTAGSGTDLKMDTGSLSLKSSVSLGVSKKISTGVSFDAGMAGGVAGSKMSGVPTGAYSLAKSAESKTGVGGQNGSKFSTDVVASAKASLGESLTSAGFSETDKRQILSNVDSKINGAVQKTTTKAYEAPFNFAHVDGVPILQARVLMQERGNWSTSCKLDDLEDDSPVPAGPVVLNLYGVEFRGTVVPDRAGSFAGTRKLRVVGGSGGLDLELDAKNYSNSLVKFRTVFEDVMRDSGEVASHECDVAQLDVELAAWHRSSGKASEALSLLCDRAGCQWRVLRDGTVWVGTDAWPEVEPSGEVMHESHDDGLVRVQPDDASLVPGIVVRGQKVKKIIHSFDEVSGTPAITTECYARSNQEMFGSILDRANRKTEYAFRYRCAVVRQNADGTVDVLVDDARMKGRGVGSCRIRLGLPGATVKVPPGARCVVGWDDGNPEFPYVSDWESGTPFTSIDIG